MAGPTRDVADLVQPEWPPLRHVRRGWEALDDAERADVEARLREALAGQSWPAERRDALLHFFTFLAQVETIAIEIPLRFLPEAPPHLRPLLRRQLVDEVFHSTLFSRIAHELALPATQPPAPLASAEELLDRIRSEPDLAVTATLLNLVAEGWIETLFKHALRWGVADRVFRTVLQDEARHVHEATAYLEGLDRSKAQAAVAAFEEGMARVGAEPTVALAILDLAGEANQRALAQALAQQHLRHLGEVGLQPSPAWTAAMQAASEAATQLEERPAAPTPAPDTEWRRLARMVWLPPRDPTMQGDFDVPVGHIPRKLLTPVLIAAIGQAWARHPELNRVVARGGLWQLPHANVGVRVLLDDNELATVVVTEADRRSPSDIRRILADGILQLRQNRRMLAESDAPVPRFQPEHAALAPPAAHLYAVGLSNAGKWGLVSGAGSFVGWMSPSTDITAGVRRRIPRWRGVAYFPSWHVNLGCIQDHRVFDGRESATAVTALQEALSKDSVRAILRRPDTLAPDAEERRDAALARASGPLLAAALPPEMRLLASVGLPKYTPIVLGGLGLGAIGGALGYMLWQDQAARAAEAARAAAAARPGTGAKAAGRAAAAGAAGAAAAAAAGPLAAARGRKAKAAAGARRRAKTGPQPEHRGRGPGSRGGARKKGSRGKAGNARAGGKGRGGKKGGRGGAKGARRKGGAR